MVNLYSAIKGSNHFRKMEVNDLLFVEYTCLREETKFGIWSNNNYFAFISSGKKEWRTIFHSYEVSEGDILFVKKGANLTHQFFDDEFCAIFIFIPDDFIRTFLQRSGLSDRSPKDLSGQDSVLRIRSDELLESYHTSIQSYLSLSAMPDERLLLHKMEELLLSLFANKVHQPLTDYFISLCQDRQYHMSRLMEENFAYNLSLGEYAQLCHMSLSAFKASFKQFYHTTPGAWLKQRKLDLSTQKILGTDLTISQISFECGFEDTSHFIRLFKQRFNLTPLQFRQKHKTTSHSEAQASLSTLEKS